MFKKLITSAFITSLLIPALVSAQGSQASQASLELSSQGLGEIVNGSGHIIQSGARLSIAAIESTNHFIYLTLKSAHHSTKTTIKIASTATGKMLLSTGELIQVVATGAGNLLYASGHLLAFIPNELGHALIYSQRL